MNAGAGDRATRPKARKTDAASGAWRSLLWIASALAVLGGFELLAGVLLAAGLLLFFLGLLQAVRVSRSTL